MLIELGFPFAGLYVFSSVKCWICNGSGIIAAIRLAFHAEGKESLSDFSRAAPRGRTAVPSPVLDNARRKRNLGVAAALTLIPAVAVYPGLSFLYTHLAAQAAIAGIVFLLVCTAALASGLLLAGRSMAGAFDALEVVTIFLLAIGVLALGFIAWAVATNFHP